jgi:hypothetical protein
MSTMMRFKLGWSICSEREVSAATRGSPAFESVARRRVAIVRSLRETRSPRMFETFCLLSFAALIDSLISVGKTF